MEPEYRETHDLHLSVIRGLGWKAFSQVAIQAMALATTIVIAHMLTPREVGLVAMAAVFSSLVLVFVDLGLDAALVQRPTISEADRSTTFWVNIAVGVTLTLAGMALAGPIASLYGEPQVEELFRVISLTFLITTIGTAQGALLIREMKFRSLEIRTVIASVSAGTVAIVLAILGAGMWAIVGQYLTIASVSTALLWRASTWRPQLLFSKHSLRDLMSFSGYLMGTRLLSYLRGNVDNYLVGRYAGSAALGAYAIAYNVMLVPLTRLASPVQEVFFPALSRLRDPVRVGAAWLRSTRMVALITVPGFAGMAVVAPDFVAVVLGGQWDDAVPVLQILCWVGALQSISWQGTSVLQALDKTAWMFRFSIGVTLVTVAGFAIGVQWGIVGVATAFAITTTLTTPPYLVMPLTVTGLGARDFVRAVRGVVESAAVMAATLVGLRLAILDELPSAAALALALCAGAAVYGAMAYWRVPEARDELRQVRERREAASAHGVAGPEDSADVEATDA